MELCLQRLRSYLTTEQTAKFLLIMEKYKTKKELNLFKLWGIKKSAQSHHPIVPEDDDGGLPWSGNEDEEPGTGKKSRANNSAKSPPFNSATHLPPGGYF